MRNKSQADYLREARERISALERELHDTYRALSDIATLDWVSFEGSEMHATSADDDGFIGELRPETICAIDRAVSKPRWPPI